MRISRLITSALAGGALLLAPASALASPANGELCSVQSTDGVIRASVYAYPETTHPSRAQVARAGQWCTDQVNTPGWHGASKFYDSYEDQVAVCLVHVGRDPIAVMLYSDDDSYDLNAAEGHCQEITDTPSNIEWYPG